MDLQHVRAFVAVAREGNLTRAAERLHLTQAAVSVQLKNFQQSLGIITRGPPSEGWRPPASHTYHRAWH